MEPDDLSVLAQRAASEGPRWTRAVEDPQPPSLRREQASLEGTCISFDARSKGQPWPLPYREVERIGRACLGTAAYGRGWCEWIRRDDSEWEYRISSRRRVLD